MIRFDNEMLVWVNEEWRRNKANKYSDRHIWLYIYLYGHTNNIGNFGENSVIYIGFVDVKVLNITGFKHSIRLRLGGKLVG